MIVASGTSTQTSITVVETKISNFSHLNHFMTSSFSAGFIFPWRSQILLLSHGKSCFTFSNSAMADFKSSILSDSSIRGVTMKTFCFWAILVKIRVFNFKNSFCDNFYFKIFNNSCFRNFCSFSMEKII